jgi:hypothetical protein
MLQSGESVTQKLARGAYTNTVDFKADRTAWRAKENEIEAEFKEDCIQDVGLKGHPKADKAFDLAWSRGHSAGFNEVYGELCDLSDLLLDR